MQNFFDLFALNPEFTIDKKQLEQQYLRMQSEFHPDLASQISIEQIEKSAQINEAFKILNDDFLRAAHLLALRGIDVLNDEQAVSLKPEILTEIFDLREKIELTEEIAELNQLKKMVEENFLVAILEFSGSFEMRQYQEAAQILIKARYFQKMKEEIASKLKSQLKS